jgi:hypothetical protein
MGGFLAFLVIIGFIGCFVWQFREGKRAVATTSLVTRNQPEQAAQVINGAFGGPRSVIWTKTSGPGSINMRRRGIHRGITMSIDIEPLPQGGCRVDMWASEFTEVLVVMVNFAGVVNRRKKAIARMLAEPAAQHAAVGTGVPSHRPADRR